MYREEDFHSLPWKFLLEQRFLNFDVDQLPGELVKSIFSQSTPRWSDLVGLQPELHTSG